MLSNYYQGMVGKGEISILHCTRGYRLGTKDRVATDMKLAYNEVPRSA